MILPPFDSEASNFRQLAPSTFGHQELAVTTKLSRIADNFIELYDICSNFSSKEIILKVVELGEIAPKNNFISSESWLMHYVHLMKILNMRKSVRVI